MWKKTLILTIVCVFTLAIVSIAEDRVPVKNELQKRFDRNRDGFIDRGEQKALQKFQEIRERIEKLRSMAREVEEKSKRLWSEAKELEQVLKREFGQPAKAERMEKMHAQLAELKEAIEHAKREGQHDKADELRKKAWRMADEIKAHVKEAAKTALREKAHAIKNEIERLHAMAAKAKEAGYHEKAKAILREAKNLQRQLRDVAKGAIFAFAPSMSGEREVRPTVTRHSAASQPASERSGGERNSLKVMTLNVAHGRGDGPNQILQKGKTIRANLDEIAAVLRRVGPDMAAIQEADGPSVWSGKVDQVSYLAEKAGFAYSVHGEHVKGMKISYGTGLLSMPALREPLAITFEASPPTFSKGFVVATVDWPGEPNIKVDVVSVHLDFLRKSVRGWQVEDMIDKLSSRGRPLIVMGDFNCEWKSKESAVRAVAEGLNLKAYQPTGPEMDTFPLLRMRMDWILISPGLEFVTYKVLPDVISDHYGVVCEIRMKD